MKTEKQFPPRQRFNWGYWDARANRVWGTTRQFPLPRFDPDYCAGYRDGQCCDLREADSDAAWERYRAAAE